MDAVASNLMARLDRLPASRFHLTVLVVAALSLFFDTLDTVVTGFAFGGFRAEWGLKTSALGITSAIGLSSTFSIFERGSATSQSRRCPRQQ